MIDEELRKIHPEQFEDTPTEMLKSQPEDPENLEVPQSASQTPPDFQSLIIQYAPEIRKRINEMSFGERIAVKSLLSRFVPSEYQEVMNDYLSMDNNPEHIKPTTLHEPHTDPTNDDRDESEISPREWKEILAEIVELDSEGIQEKQIGDIIYQNYNVDLHHMKIRSALNKFYNTREVHRDASGRTNTSELSPRLKTKIRSLLDLNKKLTDEITEIKKKEEKPKIGLLRKLWKAIY